MSAVIAAYIGLGSNLDTPATQLVRALASLRQVRGTSVGRVSSFYRNPPLGPVDQPDYINVVAAIATTLGPRALLDAMQVIERAQGRERSGLRWGPRTLDLDLLTYADETISESSLKIPHPGIALRAFVLLPLHEIAPDLVIPGHGRVTDLLAALDTTAVIRMPDPVSSI